MLEKMQTEKGDQTLVVKNMNGLSAGQHLNNLGICTNGNSDPTMNAQAGAGQGSVAGMGVANQADLVTERSMRNSEIVSHSDTILDMAMVEFKS